MFGLYGYQLARFPVYIYTLGTGDIPSYKSIPWSYQSAEPSGRSVIAITIGGLALELGSTFPF